MRPARDAFENDDTRHVPPAYSESEGPSETLVDDLLVHALLVGHFRDTPQAMQSRADRARLGLESSAVTVWQPWRVGLSTAAAAVVVVGLILIFSSPQNVQAHFGQVLEAFDAGDKTYRIDIGKPLDFARGPLRPGQRGQGGRTGPRPAGRRLAPRRLDGALLYTRGRQYVLVCTTPSGRKITKGFDGQQSWLTHPWQQPRISNDPNLLQEELPEDVASLLFLNLRDILHQVRANYRLHELADAEAPNGRLPIRHFVATRRSQQRSLPQRIELWFDPETDQLEQIVCGGGGPRGRRPTLRISLIDTDPLPTDWFTPQAHLSETPAP